jgi:hypothetical protein
MVRIQQIAGNEEWEWGEGGGSGEGGTHIASSKRIVGLIQT